MDSDLIKNISVVVFFMIQLFAVIMYLIFRYHMTRFSMKNDKKAKVIQNLFGLGIIISAAVAGFTLLQALSAIRYV